MHTLINEMLKTEGIHLQLVLLFYIYHTKILLEHLVQFDPDIH